MITLSICIVIGIIVSFLVIGTYLHVTKKSPNLDSETQKFINCLGKQPVPPLYEMAIPEARKFLEDLQNPDGSICNSGVDRYFTITRDLEIPGTKIRVYYPAEISESEILPTIVYIHGGGWILGSENTHDRLIRELCNRIHAGIVFVKYQRAPEAKWPMQIFEGVRALSWAVNEGHKYGLDPSRVILMGDSVGGNMATVVARITNHKILAQVLMYPVTDSKFNTESYRQLANGPWLTKKAMQWFWDAYVPNHQDRMNPLAAPLKASLNDLKRSPPALILTGENDVLRDEGEAYAKRLNQAGVETTSARIKFAIHDFMMLNGVANTSYTRSATDMVVKYCRNKFAGN